MHKTSIAKNQNIPIVTKGLILQSKINTAANTVNPHPAFVIVF